MAGDDIRRKTRRKHGVAADRPHKSHRTDGDNDLVPQPDRPADITALRKARLEYLETPPEERPGKMKYEYVPSSAGRRERAKEERVERRHTATATASRPKSEGTRQQPRRKQEQEEDSSSDDEENYVYGKPNTEMEKSSVSRSKSRRRGSVAHKANPSKDAQGNLVEERRTAKRRHTEPLKRRQSYEPEERISTSEAARGKSRSVRPVPRRSSTVATSSKRTPIKRSATSQQPRTEVSVAKSIGPPRPERKGSSIFSTLLLPKPLAAEKKVSCLTCGADDVPISKSAKLPCTHRMCHTCLKRVFKMSVKDPAHMPPKCCTNEHIDLKHVDRLFDQDFKKTWNRKFLEYKTKNRIYCPARGCGEWIQPQHITNDHGRKVGKCKKCGTRVCAICNNKAHASRDCPKDPATKQFVEVAKQSGWQKCFNCSAMVELKEGCNHMTCRCTAEFCMVCGLKWKSCDCPWFNYEQIDAHLGNPARYQDELDRRRDQEQRDEALARRMEALGIDDNDQHNVFGIGNAADHHMNQNFIQQAREALTANYANAEQAARDLLNGWVTGRENRLPGFPAPADQTPQLLRQPSRRHRGETEGGIVEHRPARRATVRRRGVLDDMFAGRSQTTEEREQERRIHDWANGVTSS